MELCGPRRWSGPFVEERNLLHLSGLEPVFLTLANDQLDAQILIYLLQSFTCTCLELYLAHRQEVKLY